MASLNDTHDPDRRSWIEAANLPDAEFPVQNLPLGVFRPAGGSPRGGVAIGDRILDLGAAVEAGLFAGDAEDAARATAGAELNPLLALGNEAASALRRAVSDILTRGSGAESAARACLANAANCELLLPVRVRSFTDFLCSDEHAKRMSPTGALPRNYASIPIAYHGRATTVRASGTPLRRPNGQYPGPDGSIVYGPEPSQDFELELGFYAGPGNRLGEPIPIGQARDRIFGYCLLNDWSARAIQFWEGQPLGPFLGKSLMTSVSPWIVTAEALAPFALPARRKPPDAPSPPHLVDPDDQASGRLTLELSADWTTEAMRLAGSAPRTVTRTDFGAAWWTPAQMLAHHTSNGCELEPGDLFGTGTLSGPERGSWACLAELSEKGKAPIDLGGESRIFLEDGDEIVFRGRAAKEGFVPVGFGECRGRILPALPLA